MDDINEILERTGLSTIPTSGLTIISLLGVSDKSTQISPVILANRIVGSNVFSHRKESLKEGTIELVERGLQLYVNTKINTLYLFLDSTLDTSIFINQQKFTVMDYQNINMKGLLFMFIISHLVIPILPPSLLPADFLSTLVTLSQTKLNMYTHLAQFQSCCWKYWDIPVPNALFEKKEFDRVNPNFLGWWGPAKGVPMLVFVAANIPFPEITSTAIKRMQESLQIRLKSIFRALHLAPLKQEPGNSSHAPVDVKSLFLLPSTSQPIIHIVPSVPQEFDAEQEYIFDQPISISNYLQQSSNSEPNSSHHEYGDNLLRNFVTIWAKTATSRHPLHKKMNDTKHAPLPTPIQFASAAVPLLYFLFNQPMRENGTDFREIIIAEYSSTKGMIQQIEVILRKKIKDNIEIERVFSKNYCYGVMQNCHETYLQDSPSFYPEKYHIWKRDSVLRQYKSLARGSCKEEYAARLERECDLVWKQDRQSCEHLSLTDRFCRLKIGHEAIPPQSQKRDDRTILIETGKHSSGFTFFHACNCGRSQKLRDDPFAISVKI
ncbi:hypothetical protein G6F16_001205 [Rhizopus arrhizus]|nr:hypothetical protein G6F16_001205 [Rhizopus arrhizus]